MKRRYFAEQVTEYGRHNWQVRDGRTGDLTFKYLLSESEADRRARTLNEAYEAFREGCTAALNTKGAPLC